MFCLCHRDNYGFVTYYDTKDAFTAIESGSKLRKPDELPFDLCFGGRRQFCQSSYADLGTCQSTCVPVVSVARTQSAVCPSKCYRHGFQNMGDIGCNSLLQRQQKKNASTKTKYPKTWHIT